MINAITIVMFCEFTVDKINFVDDYVPPKKTGLDSLSGHVVCFTGRAAATERNELSRLARRAGAQVSEHITRATSLLVVGEHGSPRWISSSGGRKIHTARGDYGGRYQITIITEEHFFEMLGM